MTIITVTGTPGTGKTTVARLVAQACNFGYIDVHSLIVDKKLYSSYNKMLNTYEVSPNRLNKVLLHLANKVKKGAVIDSHLSHYLPKKSVTLCIVIVCELKTLAGRLKKRGYSERKIRENTDAELFRICLLEAEKRHSPVLIIDTTHHIPSLLLKKVITNELSSRIRKLK